MKNRKSKNQGLRFNETRTLRYIHFFLGLILVAAGTLRLYDFGFGTQEDDLSALLFGVLSEAELFAGIWLLWGGRPEQTRPWVIAVFAGFWVASAFHVLTGRCSCGCFGSTAVNPWFALVFNLAAIAILLKWQPSKSGDGTMTASGAIGYALIALLVGIAGIGGQSLVAAAGTATRNGHPLEDSRLIFAGNGGNLEVTTDHVGVFHLPPARPGRYTVTAPVTESLSDSKPDSPKSGLLEKTVLEKYQRKSYGIAARRKGQQESQKELSAVAKRELDRTPVAVKLNDCSSRNIVLNFPS
jgi:hypothetical protein